EVNKALTENTGDYFSYLSKDENSVVIASVTAQGDASISKELLQGLESIGVDPRKSLITVVENGQATTHQGEFSYEGLRIKNDKETNQILFK
ncbi:MAG: hypothetical protein RSE24_04830, partial [Oscillospiraceae bacterium]